MADVRLRDALSMLDVTYTEPGKLGLTFKSGDHVEITEVKPGSTSAKAGVQEGWLIKRINGLPMDSRSHTFRQVTAAMQNPRRPLHVQFALKDLGGGWLFDIPVKLPDGCTDVVSVAQQDEVKSVANLKSLLVEQHCVAHLPLHAIQLVLVRQIAKSGLLGVTTWTGEAEQPIFDNMAISTLRKRIDGGFETISIRVEAPHIWSAKIAGDSDHPEPSAGAAACSELLEPVGNFKPAIGTDLVADDNEVFELTFEENVTLA